ncbi:hypothetical protein VYU27_008830, partial [Nannochloropsis oceanica]
KKYILKSKERVWGELLEGEDDATVPLRPKPKTGPLIKEGEEERQDEEGVEERARKMEKLMDEVFSKEKDCAALVKVLRQENINYQTEREQYSPLTILCGRADVTEGQIKHALYLGAHKFHRDEDGCTALHWAAMKGVVAAATVLTSGTNHDVEKLLAIKDGDQKTPLDLAKESVEPAHEEVEAILLAAMKKLEAARMDALE